MKLFIEPNDILMFRDGRPFAGGDDHFARGVFPPSPATIYGALRSHILSVKWSEFNKFKNNPEQIPEEVRKEIGTPHELGSLTLGQFSLARRNGKGVEQIFPMPKDVVKAKGDEKEELCVLMPAAKSSMRTITDLPGGLTNMWHPTEKPMESATGFLSLQDMADYLLGKSPSNYIKPDKLFQTEERTGVKKSRMTRSVETGRLYSVEYFRMNEDTGFSVEVEGTELLPPDGMLRLGGDNRSARYSTEDWQGIPIDPIKTMIAESKRFKLVLIAPAVFNNGWLPGWINAATLQGQFNGVTLKMTGACIGKPIGIGGYDFVKNMPKVMKKAVPAGSVYYFELANSDVDSLFTNGWLKSISDEKAQEGFGITLIGGY